MPKKTTRILGLDPGETTGWGLVEFTGASAARVIDHGVIFAPGNPPSEGEILTTTRRRLVAMLAVMKADGITGIALEAPAYDRKFDGFAGDVRGVIKEAVADAGLGWYLINVQQGRAAVGVKVRRKKGEPRLPRNAAKKAVKAAVEERFGLADLSFHEADAIACALAFADEEVDDPAG